MNYKAGNCLYNLAEDPEEDINLYDDPAYRDIVIELAGLLDARAQAIGDSTGSDLAHKALLGIRSSPEYFFYMPGFSS